ncbi:peptide-methionine (S)-S-oxide reductase MsrA [Paracraurococcus ruber]|uniref:Peptide methionine sulfoxide reductase MsrA n=1 Tax=Paracraurococcus ruber TaxID=77675 RepID=A0ABS1CUY8_9PROT|nr:peptide-methionine (S)-S-oxide reductase MsrA [Paracraurococcus ruber]MBK1658041.1 peptide-methionine (S)-S-oxide reductase [Paracraurococcus ruber]TDG31741.1 peptide-methionine (S)-S-oxide reductase [Paracraurococcus ruber]
MSTTEKAGLETATLGGGCFWCLDAVFRDLRGVASVHSGYSGGHVPNPSYEQVCGKKTGHAEVVQIAFDPQEISFADLLRVFFTIHDPTTKDRQGNDIGPQYRSVILYHSPEQKAVAEQVMAEVTQAGIWDGALVTELVPFEHYWPGEPEHQDYFARNPWSGYCRVVVAPKVQKFRKTYAERLKRPAA